MTAAGALALASAGIAFYRSGEAPAPVAAVHGTAAPDQPAPQVGEMIARLEARLRADPDDAQGWRMLGWSHFETGDLIRSAAAYRRAAELEPGNAENWSSLGEALQSATTQVSPDAAEAFARALKIDPKDPRARYFTAVQKDLGGAHQAAIADWIALLRDTPAGAPWEADLRRTIQQTTARERIDLAGRMPAAPAPVATAAIPGPTPQQLAAAAAIPPAEQDAMARGMVEGLAARLAANPDDSAGWIRLMRARMVLGEPEAARAALVSARAAFRGNAAVQSELTRAAALLGIPGGD
ncbi:tetratricopeptide repeat protein [Sphingosinicella sp. LY1275]|uniref:tetratricopeptide repeat protein n=1 Tax=Sphingosinicella sp. LY1275 TaxID=3095379 RepID=UPI002ADEED3D|nr:tetratricopeptide repeat protein [Sphingosinicella sp. LY1275]MEA1013005.1 tetratricopeptide repeat protein [Sphingosinicella sp. LY1275]